MTIGDMSNDTIEALCNHCGQTFSAFLHEMADQNAKVVCPNCRQTPDCKPAKAGTRVAKGQTVKKTH